MSYIYTLTLILFCTALYVAHGQGPYTPRRWHYYALNLCMFFYIGVSVWYDDIAYFFVSILAAVGAAHVGSRLEVEKIR